MTRPWHIRRWDRYASAYDRFFQFKPQRRISLGMAAIRPGERVLICGCGTGSDFEFITPGACILAIDASPAMLDIAKAKARAFGHEAQFEVMDATRLNLETARFDVVVLHLIAAVVPDHAAVLNEAARVLKPQGRIALFDKYFSGPGKPRLVRRLMDPLMALIATSINVPIPALAAQAGLRFVREEPVLLRGMFRAALLEKVQPSSNSSV